MALTEHQSTVLRAIARNRTPHSHVAGGAALNRSAPRLSSDIDIFQDPPTDVAMVAAVDVEALTRAGFEVSWLRRLPTFHSAAVRSGETSTLVDWAQDSAWRFFPALPDPEFGYVLHPVDLATNKALAAAGRRVARDAIDLLYIDAAILPLGALACAAVGKDPGYSPESLLSGISRSFARLPTDFADISSPEPIDAGDISRRLHEAIERARDYVARMPSEATGHVFLSEGAVVAPDPGRLDAFERRGAANGGVWPLIDELGSEWLRR